MNIWVFLGLVKVLGGLADVTVGGTLLKQAFTYTVYILKPEDGSLVCMGVIMDSLTVVTAAHCKVKPRTHLVKLASIPETETESDMAIKGVITVPPDAELGVTIVWLENPIPLPGDDKTPSAVMWDTSGEHEVGKSGIVPAIGYPPKAVGLELVHRNICKTRMLEIIDEKGWHDLDSLESIMCAQKAQEPVSVMKVGRIDPGMTCKDLGAPLLLNGIDQVSGLLVYSDCPKQGGFSKAFFVTAKYIDTPESTAASTTGTSSFLPIHIYDKPKEIQEVNMRNGIEQKETLCNAGAKLAPLSVIGSLAVYWDFFL